jgi:hypothetical protein
MRGLAEQSIAMVINLPLVNFQCQRDDLKITICNFMFHREDRSKLDFIGAIFVRH